MPEQAGQVPVQGSQGRVPAVQAQAPERAVQEQAVQAQAPERAVQEQAVQARAPEWAAQVRVRVPEPLVQVRGLEPVDQQKGWVEGPAMEPGMERSVASAPRRR